MTRFKIAKIVCAVLVTILFGLMIRSLFGLSETRGVHDDVLYLRQAHLFQRFGAVKGLDTDIANETDGFLAAQLRAIGYPKPDDPLAAPGHSRMAATGRIVMQYPPGTGFVMAAFPERFQVVPLYATVAGMLWLVALATILIAATPGALAAATGLGVLSLYLMNNPMKSSFSLPPTMIVCVLAGGLTALVARATHRAALAALLGLVFGLGVNFRIANLFLLAGAGIYLLMCFVRRPRMSALLDGAVLGVAALIGMGPTLAANAINAGSPVTTTYSAQDAMPPDFAPTALAGQAVEYLTGTQGALNLAAVVLTILACLKPGPLRQAGLATALMLAVNLGYFISHPVSAPYYTVPLAMLAFWTLLFAFLLATRADGPGDRQMLIRAAA